MSGLFDITLENLHDADQLQLLTFLDTLEVPQEVFLSYLESFDYIEINRLYKESVKNAKKYDSSSKLKPVEPGDISSIETTDSKEVNRYTGVGLLTLADGHVCVLLFDDENCPVNINGKTKIGLLSGKPLYQIYAEKIRGAQISISKKVDKAITIKWFIMVTVLARPDHEEYFKKHSYFGLHKSDVYFIEQEVVPCFNTQGKILLEDRNHIALTSTGSGGVFPSLQPILEAMDEYDIKYMYAFSLCNLLENILDPTFIGYCVHNICDCGVKVIQRQPGDTLGILGKMDNQFCVVPVDDFADDLKKHAFKYRDSTTYFFDIEFLSRVAKDHLSEIAFKARKTSIPYKVDSGTTAYIDSVAIKKPITDAFKFSKKLCLWEIPRNDFLAIKLQGDKIVSDVLDRFYDAQRRCVVDAGGKVEGKEVEVSPLLVGDEEAFKALVSGRLFKAPIVIATDEEHVVVTRMKSGPSGLGRGLSKLGKSLVSLGRGK